MKISLPPLLLVAALGCGAPEKSATPAGPSSTSPAVSASTAASAVVPAAPVVKNDDFLYLEEVMGERALAFARSHNALSENALTSEPGFAALRERLFSINSSKERIPSPTIANESVRNFWTDSEHPRGLWRMHRGQQLLPHDGLH